MKKIFLCLVGVLTQVAPASAAVDLLPRGNALHSMSFIYQPVEDVSTFCTHEQIRDLPDWNVSCETPYGKKTFKAHVIIRENPRGHNTGLEILYWVTAPGDKPTSPGKYHSTTLLLNLEGDTKMQDFALSQGVENDMAYLMMRWQRAPAVDLKNAR
jgi:hypothetical protein